jgi:transcriptional regulator with XRE-family HTH domain
VSPKQRKPRRPASSYDRSTVGGRIREARKRREFKTQKDLAKAVGVGPDSIKRWENADVLPPAENLGKLVKALGVNLGWLASGEGEPYVGDFVPTESARVPPPPFSEADWDQLARASDMFGPVARALQYVMSLRKKL